MESNHNLFEEKVKAAAGVYYAHVDESSEYSELRVIKAYQAGVKSDIAKEYHNHDVQLLQEENQKMKVIFEKLHYFMKDGTINRPYKLEKSLFEKICEVLGKDKPVVKLQLETDAD